MELVKKIFILAAEMLKLASDEFSNHGCNDVDKKLYRNWTVEERQRFVQGFHRWNGDPENYDDDFLNLGDSVIMNYLASILENYHYEKFTIDQLSLKEKFTEEFINEFLFDAEFNNIFEAMSRGLTPYSAIELLCRGKRELFLLFQETLINKPHKIILTNERFEQIKNDFNL